MNNVVPMSQRLGRSDEGQYVSTGSAASSIFDRVWADSPLNFRAYERDVWYEGKTGTRYNNTGRKALIRMGENGPKCLNVVNSTYKTVQNDELFRAIHDGITRHVGARELETCEIRDNIAYGGTQCFREYRFPDISFASPESDKIAFRIIVHNGFGSGAIKLYAGAIDFFCTNGLVLGEYTSLYGKHTKGLSIGRFGDTVAASIDIFWKNREFFNGLRERRVLSDEVVSKWLNDNFGDRLGNRLFHQYVVECKVRGRTLWSVYSALTYYSSHAVGEFALRKTANDHAAATMMKRENDVRKAVGGILELAA